MKNYHQIFKPYRRVIFYCVDPGCYNLFKQISKSIRQDSIFFCQGWAQRETHLSCPDIMLPYLKAKSGNSILVLGAQTNFQDTQYWIKKANLLNIKTAFIFDHWKNYKQHFKQVNYCFPDYIFVPDIVALKGFMSSFPYHVQCQLKTKTFIGEHLSLLEQTKEIHKLKSESKELISIFLDPEAENSDLYPGYDPRSTLEGMAEYIRRYYPDEAFIIKPHPRQNLKPVMQTLHSCWQGIKFEVEKVRKPPEIMARSKQVWGVTSLCLVMAKMAGVPIKSFQINRNAIGFSMTNDYIESNVLTEIV